MPRSFFYVGGMKRILLLSVLLPTVVSGLSSCVETAEKKPPGPVSDTSNIPWNSPISGQGQGQFGMLPQNQYRR